MNHSELTILLIEDDIQIRNFMVYVLKQDQFQTLVSGTAKHALDLFATNSVDLILLDLGLPDCDGMEVIEQLRTLSDLPIIVVSARDQDQEKVAALDTGADDYLTKPFSTTELLARIRVALRHHQKGHGHVAQTFFCVSELSMDLEKRQVSLSGQELHTTPMEYALLSLLFKNMGKVLTTHTILKEIWGIDYGTDTQALRALMAGLRRKIEENPGKPRYIITEIGIGYRLADQ